MKSCKEKKNSFLLATIVFMMTLPVTTPAYCYLTLTIPQAFYDSGA